jgi:hypothetical protein
MQAVLAKDLGEVQLVVGQGLFFLEALGPAHKYVSCYTMIKVGVTIVGCGKAPL